MASNLIFKNDVLASIRGIYASHQGTLSQIRKLTRCQQSYHLGVVNTLIALGLDLGLDQVEQKAAGIDSPLAFLLKAKQGPSE